MSELYGSAIMYLCDPDKNTGCAKTYCQRECFHCHEKEFSKDGKPLRFNLITWRWEQVPKPTLWERIKRRLKKDA